MSSNYLIGEFCSFAKGASVPRDRMLGAGSRKYLHYGDLYKGHELYIDIEKPTKPIPFISEEERVKPNQFVSDGDIIYVLTSETIDDLGKALMVKGGEGEEIVAGTETTVMRVENREIADPAYINYMLQTELFKRKLRQYVTGMKVFRVHPRDIAKIEVSLPDIETQNKVVRVLDAIYEKRSTVTHLNDYLAELVSLEFMNRFSENVPTVELGQVLSISTKSLRPQDCSGEVWEHYSIPAYDEKHRPVFEPADGIKSNKYIVDKDCILISKLNPSTKRIWMPTCSSNRPVCSTEFIVYKPNEPKHKSFYYAAIDAPAFTDFLLAHVTGSTGSRQRTQPKATLVYPMPAPGTEAIEDFCAYADPIYEQIKINERESRQLEELRDVLLPRLMSGETDVSKVDIEQLHHLAIR